MGIDKTIKNYIVNTKGKVIGAPYGLTGQCPSSVRKFLVEYCGYTNKSYGDAKDYVNIPNGKIVTTPKAGDLVVYLENYKPKHPYGHVGVMVNSKQFINQWKGQPAIIQNLWNYSKKVFIRPANVPPYDIEVETQSVPEPQTSTDLLTLVKRAIRGDFGNGEKRKLALGDNYAEVQKQVNMNFKKGTTKWSNIKLY